VDDDFIPDTRTDEERAKSYRYWASRTPAERFAETLRLSIERYGMPIGDIRDGPIIKYRRNPDGTKTVISE
jgi:hypothetical protein